MYDDDWCCRIKFLTLTLLCLYSLRRYAFEYFLYRPIMYSNRIFFLNYHNICIGSWQTSMLVMWSPEQKCTRIYYRLSLSCMFENDDYSDFAFGNISFVWWKFEEAVGVSYESNQMDFIDEEIALPMRCFRPRTFSYLRFPRCHMGKRRMTPWPPTYQNRHRCTAGKTRVLKNVRHALRLICWLSSEFLGISGHLYKIV